MHQKLSSALLDGPMLGLTNRVVQDCDDVHIIQLQVMVSACFHSTLLRLPLTTTEDLSFILPTGKEVNITLT